MGANRPTLTIHLILQMEAAHQTQEVLIAVRARAQRMCIASGLCARVCRALTVQD